MDWRARLGAFLLASNAVAGCSSNNDLPSCNANPDPCCQKHDGTTCLPAAVDSGFGGGSAGGGGGIDASDPCAESTDPCCGRDASDCTVDGATDAGTDGASDAAADAGTDASSDASSHTGGD